MSDGSVESYEVTYFIPPVTYSTVTNSFGCGKSGGVNVTGDSGFTVSRIEVGTNHVFNYFESDLVSVWAKDFTRVQFNGQSYLRLGGSWMIDPGTVYLPTNSCITVIATEPFYLTVGGNGQITGTGACGEAPTIVLQPQDTEAIAGETAFFQSDATGTQPLFYTWQFEGQTLSNVAGNSLTLTDVQPGQAGHYRVLVTNAFGNVTSEVAVLTIAKPELPHLVISPRYFVASNSQPEFALSSAFDGTNFLIGIRGDATGPDSVGAQLLSPAGARVGDLITTGRTIAGRLTGPHVAYGRTNYLMVWTDAASQHASTSNDVYG